MSCTSEEGSPANGNTHILKKELKPCPARLLARKVKQDMENYHSREKKKKKKCFELRNARNRS